MYVAVTLYVYMYSVQINPLAHQRNEKDTLNLSTQSTENTFDLYLKFKHTLF